MNQDQNHDLDEIFKSQQKELVQMMQSQQNMIKHTITKCIICKKNPRNIVILICGHNEICEDCKDKLKEKICPTKGCKKSFTKTTKIQK